MLAIIGSKDITKHIQAESWAVDSNDIFERWQDGNYRTHKVKTRSQVTGSFSVICSESTGMTSAEFLELLESNTVGEVLTITLLVNNKAQLDSIECFYSIKTKTHTDLVDIYEISIEER